MLSRVASRVLQGRVPLWVRSSSTTHRTADPALYSQDTEGVDADETAQFVANYKQDDQEHHDDDDHKQQKKKPTRDLNEGTHHRLESSGVNPPINPINQQKRHHQQMSPPVNLEEVSCVGVDGTPLPPDENEEQRIQDNKDYFKDRKASPLSEIEVADTRKPVTAATDGTGDYFLTSDLNDVVGFREEQLDTAEDSLRRATLIWKESAMRGDPDSPQSRALRAALLAAEREHAAGA